MNNEFQKRLYHFEISPPATAWDKIVLALNEPQLAEEFAAKLYNVQVPPPPGTWQRISDALANTSNTGSTFIQRIKPYYRYAAAAVMIGFITFLISLFINKQHIANVAKEQTIPSKQNVTSPENIKPDNNQKAEATVYSNDLPEPNKKRLIAASLNRTGNRHKSYSSPALLQTNYSVDHLEEDAEYLDYSSPAINYDQSKISHINNYIILLRPDGSIIRISKKFADMIGCMYTSSSNAANENCHEQINSWRNKMAKSHVSPSQDNFMDILTLIKSLQDN